MDTEISWQIAQSVELLGYRLADVRFPAQSNDLSLLHDVKSTSEAHPAPLSEKTRSSSRRNDRGVKLTSHLHLMARLRMTDAIQLLPPLPAA
jgi:hypothetical protein